MNIMDPSQLGNLLGGSYLQYPPGSPDSHLSDVSFPSHISGFESFMDCDETGNHSIHTNDEDLKSSRLLESEEHHQSTCNTILNEFLKMSSPPKSASASQYNSLNDSSMSLTQLEELKEQLHDSFLNSQADDVANESRLKKFLEHPKLTSDSISKQQQSLSEMIDFANSSKKKKVEEVPSVYNDATASLTMIEENHILSREEKELNQTELDSLFLKEVRERLQLSSVESSKHASVYDGDYNQFSSGTSTADEIDETIREIEKETKVQDNNNFHLELQRKLSQEIMLHSVHDNIDEGFVRECIENIQRPNLDGSSCDSDDDLQPSHGALNFARTAVHTSMQILQQQLEHVNMENIPERQLAEGGDDEDEVFNDGGGGGDGSSGHSDTDGGGGDGGVSIRNASRIVRSVSAERDVSDDERSTPPNRERPVGGSGPADGVTRPRQVQFVTPPVPVTVAASESAVNLKTQGNADSQSPNQDGTPDNQNSRLSSRYFLAASTPFKSVDQTITATWMNQSSFHVPYSNKSSPETNNEDWTLTGADVTVATPSTATLSRLKKEAGGISNWTFNTPADETAQSSRVQSNRDETVQNKQVKKKTDVGNKIITGAGRLKNSFQSADNPFSGQDSVSQNASKKSRYNPFEAFGENQTNIDISLGFDFDGSVKSEDFQTTKQDLEGMLLEDEKIVALNNNSVYKNDDETTVSEWSLRSENQRITSTLLPQTESKAEECEDGRVSVYFKVKSNELGRLSGEHGARPQFSDDSHEVITPPTAVPFTLVKQPTSIEQTIPRDSTDLSKTFLVDAPNAHTSIQSSGSETPKTTLVAPHRRQAETILTKPLHSTAKPRKSTKTKKKRIKTGSNRKESSTSSEDYDVDTVDTETNKDDANLNGSIFVPVSEKEADELLGEIKRGRVSTIGMNKGQIYNLAKCITSMTGVDFNLVYKLILLLPANAKPQREVQKQRSSAENKATNTSLCREQKNTDFNVSKDLSTPSKISDHESLHYAHSPVRTTDGHAVTSAGQQQKPISSVLPLSSRSDIQSTYNPLAGYLPQQSYTTQNIPTSLHRLQSTRLTDRFSDPNPCLPSSRYYDDRAAVSISPVPYHRQDAGAKHAVIRDCFSGEKSFYPLPPQSSSYDQMRNQFHELKYAPRSVSQPELRFSGSHQSSHRSMATESFLQYSNSIRFPAVVSFEVGCVGVNGSQLLQVHNSNHLWMQCKLNVVFYAYNGREADLRQMNMFSFPPKITIEPHSTEDVKIAFLAHQPGAYMIKIEVMATTLVSEDVTIRWHRIPGVLSVEAVAETPDIEVLLNDGKSIDFGDLAYGRSCLKELQILNKGRATIPLRLCIGQGTIACKYFSFVLEEDSKTVYAPTKLSVTVPGRRHEGLPMKPVCVPLKFDAPVKKISETSALFDWPPEEFTCQLDIEAETKPILPVTSVLMRAMVGLARLHSLRTMQAITLTCVEGHTANRTIPLKNAGNITLNLEAKVFGATHYFAVQPDILSIKPGMESELILTFKSHAAARVESRLLVNVLTSNEQYEWQLEGSATSKLRTVTASPTKPMLLCNKLSLNWSGVPLGQSNEQKLTLKNDSYTDYIHLTIAVAGDHPNFKLRNDYILQQMDTNVYEASIKPQGELPVHVIYSPTFFNSVSSSLVFRTTDRRTKFIVPLSGYGGCSNLDISGAKKVNDKFWIEIGNINLGKTNVINLMLRNSGTRSAFVSMKCFRDLTAKLEYPVSHVHITPNNFILSDKTSCQVKLLYQPFQETALRSLEESTQTVGHLVIYSGDEVLRREYKRNNMMTGKSDNDLLNTMFTNDHAETNEVRYTNLFDWDNFFGSNIATNVIALVSTCDHKFIKEDVSYDKQKMKEVAHVTPAFSVSTGTDAMTEYWSVYPEQIILSSYEEAAATKLYITNQTDLDMDFEFIWPAQTLVITPCKDKIPPRSKLAIRVNAKPSFLSRREELPWRGSIYIQCNGEQKCVQVQIRVDTPQDNSKQISSAMPQSMSGNIKDSQSKNPVSVTTVDNSLTIFPQILEFSNTKTNMVTDLSFTITNKSEMVCRWFLSSIAPPYLKKLKGNYEIQRTSYAAFKFAKHSGKLNPKQCFMLPVSFLPRNGGMYSQFWDFEASYDHNPTPVKIRLELIGQSTSSESDAAPDLMRKQIGTAKPIMLDSYHKNSRDLEVAVTDKNDIQRSGHVFIKDDTLEFPRTNVGERSEMKFRLCNDSQDNQKVRLSSLSPPFSVISKHSKLSIRPKSYIRVPVYYAPTTSQEYSEGVLVVTPLTGENICINLCGKSS